MAIRPVHHCLCQDCQSETAHPNKPLHHHLNLLLSRLNEQQRRWVVALESKKLGYGGDKALALITGMDEKTISRGRQELDQDLVDQPLDQIRRPGGGRPLSEKKSRP